MEFIVGQRWVSQAEPQMGLGIIVEADGRHVTVHYPAIEEDRIYASDNAPLARISYQQDDKIRDMSDNSLQVKAVEEMKGLLYYLAESDDGEERIVPEPQLSAQIQLASPTQRLFSGQFDKNRLFQLRAATLHYRFVQQKSTVRGLLGSRTSLLPHQVYVAHQVANRHAPRVLLADEVGLGKTIEAGMILHHQLQTGLSNRCLILVPEPLLHQWLVEMLRKFNLRFSLFDAQRFEELREAGEDNPFESEQLILCSTSLLEKSELAAKAAIEGDWDMVIIDEAHHLEWHGPTEIGKSYQIAEALAENTEGLLLLTATPEQVGIESHYARLRLLDPTRYNNLDAFKAEQESFRILNDAVTSIQNNAPIAEGTLQQIASFVDSDLITDIKGAASLDEDSRDELIRHLLDYHGTGRVLLRNTRAAIENFPSRKPIAYPLEKAIDYSGDDSLHPELNNEGWINSDPRVLWLETFLQSMKREKVLIICARASTALELEKHLHLDIGIRSTAFHEGLSILERDRAAAYFSDDESGAQVMICSEIGSEGRNFQFAHHLVLFDLPTNPDLLEQRIGRLDRIGQTKDINIHIPYIVGTAQEFLYRWYHEGLGAFEQSFSAGHSVYQQFEAQLLPWLDKSEQANTDKDFTSLLDDTKRHTIELKNELENGRDHLLEMNSCDHEKAGQIIEDIRDAEKGSICAEYMSLVFDNFGVEQEYHSENSWVIRPTEQMLNDEFPHLAEEGKTITFGRAQALKREDMEFVTWEHPIVTDSMDMILSSEIGNCSIGAVKLKALPAGTVLLETFYAMSCSAPRRLHLDRYMPATPIRVLLEINGKELTKVLKHTQLNSLREHLKRSSRFAIVKKIKPQLEKLIQQSESIAMERALPLVETAREEMQHELGEELDRLRYLKTKNNTVRDSEITFFESRITQANDYFSHATPELQAIRVIVNTYQP